MGTTHTPSAGEVLPANENMDEGSGFTFEDEPLILQDEPLTFEQRTVRTLLGFERRHLRLREAEAALEAEELKLEAKRLDYEAARFMAQQSEAIASRYAREALLTDLVRIAERLIPTVVSHVTRTAEAEATKAQEDAFAQAEAQPRREAKSRAAVG